MDYAQLFEHQKTGIEFLLKNPKSILADEMGLGKTRQAVLAAGVCGSNMALVVCPASLKINWQREINMVYTEDVVAVLSGGDVDEAQEKVESSNSAWIVINYDILEKHRPWLEQRIAKGEIETVIFDEAHYIKDTKTIRTKAALAVAENAKRIYMLTGTPVMNRPIELFSLLRALKHPLAWDERKAPSKLRREYSVRYCDGKIRMIMRRGGGVLRFWEEKGATRLPELRELTRDIFLRRTKAEVLNLPPKILSVVECHLDAEHRKLYETAWDEYIEYVQKNPLKRDVEDIFSAQGLIETGKLKQVCSRAKIDRIVNDVENAVDQDSKVIIFSQYTETIARIASALRAKKIGTVTLTGADDMKARQEAVDGFQKSEDIKVFVANIKAGGVGLNLTAASQVMFADMEWSPGLNMQAEDRAHRIGQNGTVNIYYYVTRDTIEEYIVDLLLTKQGTIGTITGGETTIDAFLQLIARRTESSH